MGEYDIEIEFKTKVEDAIRKVKQLDYEIYQVGKKLKPIDLDKDIRLGKRPSNKEIDKWMRETTKKEVAKATAELHKMLPGVFGEGYFEPLRKNSKKYLETREQYFRDLLHADDIIAKMARVHKDSVRKTKERLDYVEELKGKVGEAPMAKTSDIAKINKEVTKNWQQSKGKDVTGVKNIFASMDTIFNVRQYMKEGMEEYRNVVADSIQNFHDANDYIREVIIKGQDAKRAEAEKNVEAAEKELSEKRSQTTQSTNIFKEWRKTLTGVLIDLHWMRIVASQSKIVSSNMMMLGKALGFLLDSLLLPMLPSLIFLTTLIIQVTQAFRQLPEWLRMGVAALASFVLTLTFSVTAISKLMDLVSWIKGGNIVKRASGGPLRAGQTALVGERGPELLVPSGSGFNVIPNGGFRALAEGTGFGVTAWTPPTTTFTGGAIAGGEETTGGGISDILSGLGGGLIGLAGGAATGMAGAMAGAMQNKTVQDIVGSLRIMGAVLGAALAPIAGIAALGGILVGGIAGLIKVNKGGFAGVIDTIVNAGQSIRNILTMLLVQMGVKKATEGTGIVPAPAGILTWLKWLGLAAAAVFGIYLVFTGVWEILKHLYEELQKVYDAYLKPVVDYLAKIYTTYIAPFLETSYDFLGELKEKILTWLGIKDVVDVGFSLIDFVVETVTSFVANIFMEAWNKIKEVIGGLFKAPKSMEDFANLISLIMPLSQLPPTVKYALGIGTGKLLGLPYADTGGFVAKTGAAVIHKGETIVPANSNQNPVNVYITVQGNMDSKATDEIIRKLKVELSRVRG
jgi:hypothetical protein